MNEGDPRPAALRRPDRAARAHADRPDPHRVVRDRLRAALERRGFLEVETPMLQTLAGGAAARSRSSPSNAFDMDLFLRIALELFLKRCVVGGSTRSSAESQLPEQGCRFDAFAEFSMLETYQAYGDLTS